MNPDNLPPLDLFHSRLPLQLRFNDVDVLGHVNNTVYFTFFDTGKAHYFEQVTGRPVDWKHVDTVVANVNCAYIAPIVFGDNIEVLTACVGISEKSFRLLQLIRDHITGQPKALCETVMVSFDPSTGKATPLSETRKEQIEAFEGRALCKEVR